MAYPEEKDKGKYIAVQWSMVAVGSGIGSIIAFAMHL
jgi:hypothetical protein